jgi:hypothetical protein
VLGVAHSSLRPSEISTEASLSSGNAKSLLGCPIHIKNNNTSFIPVGDPSTETLPSGHHKYTSHTCCIQVYSAAALGFRMFLSCGQRVRLEWMDGGFHYTATPPSDSVSKSLKLVVILAGHVCFRGHSSSHLHRSRIQGHLPF